MRLLYLQIEACIQCPYITRHQPDYEDTCDYNKSETIICGLLTAINNKQVELDCGQAFDHVLPNCPLPNATEWMLIQQSQLNQMANASAQQLQMAFKYRAVSVVDWMLRYVKWKFRQEKNIPDEFPDNQVDWSPEVQEAMHFYEELCQ